MLRRIPRLSARTWLLGLVAAASIIWCWNNRDIWVVQHTFPRAFSSLAENVSPDRRQIIVRDSPGDVESTGRLSVVDIDTAEIFRTFGISGDCRREMIISPDGTRLLTLGGWQQLTDSTNGVSTTRTLGGPVPRPHLWDLTTGNLIADLDPLPITSQACFSPDGYRIVTLENERATLYDGATGQRVAVLEKLENGMGVGHAAFFSPDSKLVVINMGGPTPIRIHSTIDGHLVATQANPIGFWASGDMPATFSPDGRSLAFSTGSTLQQIDALTGQPLVAPVRLSGSCWRLWYGLDGRRLYSLSNSSTTSGSAMTLSAIDSGTGRPVATAKTIFDLSPRVAFSPDGRELILSQWLGSIDVFDSARLAGLGSVPGRASGYSGAPFSPDGSRAVAIVSSAPATIDVLDTRTWRPASSIHDPWSQFSDAVFVRDSAHLLTATGSGTIRLWYRRRPEAMWGLIALPAFWVALCTALIWLISLRRDIRLWNMPIARPRDVADAK